MVGVPKFEREDDVDRGPPDIIIMVAAVRSAREEARREARGVEG